MLSTDKFNSGENKPNSSKYKPSYTQVRRKKQTLDSTLKQYETNSRSEDLVSTQSKTRFSNSMQEINHRMMDLELNFNFEIDPGGELCPESSLSNENFEIFNEEVINVACV